MINFQHPEYLVSLLVIALLIFLYWRVMKWKEKAQKKIGDEKLLKELVKNHSAKKFLFKFAIAVASLFLMSLALSNVRVPGEAGKVNRKGLDIVIALDVSKSMLAEDIKPSRIERARQLVGRLIDNWNDDRIALIFFAGRAYMQMPLSIDHSAAKLYAASAVPESVPTQGTDISSALGLAEQTFNIKEKKYKVVILITDGEDHDENAVSTAKNLQNEGVVINTVGIGSPQGALIPDPETGSFKTDKNGNKVVTKLNEQELKEIAAAGGGVYQLFTNTDDIIKGIDKVLAGLEKKNIEDKESRNYYSLFPWLLLVAFVLLVAEIFISERKKSAV